MLLRSSTYRRTVWSQKPDARESPFACSSGTIWKSLSLNYIPRCPIWLKRYRAPTAPTMPTSWGTCYAKNVWRLKSLIHSFRTHHHPTSVRIHETTRRWLPTQSNSPIPSSTTVMQWIITLIHTSAIQCSRRRISRWTWCFEL